jgi:membrane fusion protein (multidrug efflux system)
MPESLPRKRAVHSSKHADALSSARDGQPPSLPRAPTVSVASVIVQRMVRVGTPHVPSSGEDARRTSPVPAVDNAKANASSFGLTTDIMGSGVGGDDPARSIAVSMVMSVSESVSGRPPPPAASADDATLRADTSILGVLVRTVEHAGVEQEPGRAGLMHMPRAHVSSRSAQRFVPDPLHVELNVEPRRRARPLGMRAVLTLLIAGLLAYAVTGAATFYWIKPSYEISAQARIESAVTAVDASIPGTLLHLYVRPDQNVRAGDLLAELDPEPLRRRFAEAQKEWFEIEAARPAPNVTNRPPQSTRLARLAEANAAIATAEARVSERPREPPQPVVADDASSSAGTANAGAGEREKAAMQARATRNRRILAALTSARLRLTDLQRDEQHNAELPQPVSAREDERRAGQMRLEDVQRELASTKLIAPVAGVIGAELPTPGARVAPGRALLSIWQIEQPWVTAQFEEEQLPRIRTGQPAKLHVVALDLTLAGTVERIAFASELGQRMAGGFARVVARAQHVPVRIALQPHQPGMERLRPGMTVVTSVRVD